MSSGCVRALAGLSLRQGRGSSLHRLANTLPIAASQTHRRFGIFDSLFSGSEQDEKKPAPLRPVSPNFDDDDEFSADDDDDDDDMSMQEALARADASDEAASSSSDGFAASIQRGPSRSYTLDTPRDRSMVQAMHETDVARSVVPDPELPGELELPGGLSQHQFRYLFTEDDLAAAGAVVGKEPERPSDDLDLFRHEKVSYDAQRLTTSFPRLDGSGEAALTGADREALVRRALSWRNSSGPEVHKSRIANQVDKWARKMGDTGSPEVQIAVMTERIKMMGRHLASHRKDTKCKFYLNHVLQKRRKLMRYLRNRDMPRYKIVCDELGLKDIWDERFQLRDHDRAGYYSNKYPIKYMKTPWNTKSGRRYF